MSTDVLCNFGTTKRNNAIWDQLAFAGIEVDTVIHKETTILNPIMKVLASLQQLAL